MTKNSNTKKNKKKELRKKQIASFCIFLSLFVILTIYSFCCVGWDYPTIVLAASTLGLSVFFMIKRTCPVGFASAGIIMAVGLIYNAKVSRKSEEAMQVQGKTYDSLLQVTKNIEFYLKQIAPNGEIVGKPNSDYPLVIFDAIYSCDSDLAGYAGINHENARHAIDTLTPRLHFYENNEGVCEMSKRAKINAILTLAKRIDSTKLVNSSDKRIDRLYKKYNGDKVYQDRYYSEYLYYVRIAYEFRGQAYFELGDFENARSDYERAISMTDDNQYSYRDLSNIASTYVAQGSYEQAIEILNSMSAQSNYSYYLMGIAYFNLSRFDIAEEMFIKGRNGFRDHEFDARNYLGAVYLKQGEYQKAKEVYDSVITEIMDDKYGDLDSKYREASGFFYNRAIANLRLGMDKEAKADYDVYCKYRLDADEPLPELSF